MNRPTLLLVDDEDGIRAVLSMLLDDMGYAVRSAASGRQALEMYREKRPDIVITDIKMPGMSGIELLQAVKAENPDAEVVMLTGHGDMDLAVSSLRHGAGDFLNKPVSEEALEVALDRARGRIALREALRRHTEELETLVRERTRELVRSERFAAVGETAAGLAHSIKNIAGALEGTMFVLEKGLELDRREYFEEGWKMIRSDLGRLRALAVNMLDMGRTAALEYAPAEPAKAVREVLELAAQRAAEAGVELLIEDTAGPRPFPMAEEAVHQCLLNLVLNGIEALAGEGAGQAAGESAGPQAGEDTGPEPAGAARQGAAVRVRVSRERQNDGRESLLYAVCDNGPGMEAGADGEAFGSCKEGGSGIGLFATRKLAHDMGADLTFRSAPGKGTEAELRLFAGS